jgi:Methyltransferase domain
MPNPLKLCKRAYLEWKSAQSQAAVLSKDSDPSVPPEDFALSLKRPTDYYIRLHQAFHRELPDELRKHRDYFRLEKRGFGEDAFHAMWQLLLHRFRPRHFLEIGVYRGQVLSLVSLISKLENLGCEVTGVSPFSPAGDSVSEYLVNLDYMADTLHHFEHFGLPRPTLLKAYSTDPDAVQLISSSRWDMIYIDGNHDYEIVVRDWALCTEALETGGIVVLDDSGLTSSYKPPVFATGGHPGPSRLASEIDLRKFEEILQVGHNRVFTKL